MKIIRIETNNNIPTLFYKVIPELSYHRVPSKTFMQEGVMEIKPYNEDTFEAMRQSLLKLGARYTEIDYEC